MLTKEVSPLDSLAAKGCLSVTEHSNFFESALAAVGCQKRGFSTVREFSHSKVNTHTTIELAKVEANHKK